MYVKVSSISYKRIKNLSFNPEASVISDKVPINEFQVDVISDQTNITVGKDIYLFDDLDQLWAKYWIISAEKIDYQTTRVLAQSKLVLLERKQMDNVIYRNYPVTDLIATLFSDIGSDGYVLDPSFSGKTITGYFEEQTRKDRLQQVCFVLGAYVRSFGSEKIEILPLDDTATLIPMNQTFWKPKVSNKDYVTAVTVTAYAFVQGEPTQKDKYVEVDDVTYIQYKRDFTLGNPNVPETAPENVVRVDNVMIVNSENVSEILNRLAGVYFNRTTAVVDCINNRSYWPSDKVIAYLDSDTVVTGYVESASFRFGLQARSSLELVAAEESEVQPVKVEYYFNDGLLQTEIHMFPIGYNFEIETVYIDRIMQDHRYILRPLVDSVTGTVGPEGTTVTVQTEIAADYFENILTVYNVDAVDYDIQEHEIDISENATGMEIAESAKPEMRMSDVGWFTTAAEETE